jgi:hypothetical protein
MHLHPHPIQLLAAAGVRDKLALAERIRMADRAAPCRLQTPRLAHGHPRRLAWAQRKDGPLTLGFRAAGCGHG